MLEEGFSFWRQCDPAMGADEEFAAQFTFQAGNGSGNIGLIAGCLLYTSPSPRD